MTERRTLALIAHDAKKNEMVTFAKQHEHKLADYKLYATGTTGSLIQESCPSLHVERMKSGPLGGDQQIGALIAERALDGLFFFVDPLSPMPHDVDVKALMRLALVYDIPMALNRTTADIVLRSARLAGLSTSSQTPEILTQ
ncbi:Methylglyoxal synthase [Pseudovibrio axinellae]|uniref:Methylglyoxal synthase n=1 Tax=Pseudovibrio axinellae TaxID=989403 RepID=A0A166B8X7_9HYPH|nr:methylglyoxal synthase [Pseudovibrio axinellae]KZL22028.1 Methylglyoxal synthase [Pseudovibrio axinellae]SEQ58084.1 methylglyoxal synthase [Pseudovibrio axinellae]